MLFTADTLINTPKRLWRVDAEEGNVLRVTTLDAVQEKAFLFIPFEKIENGKLPKPDPGQFLRFTGSESSLSELRSSTHDHK